MMSWHKVHKSNWMRVWVWNHRTISKVLRQTTEKKKFVFIFKIIMRANHKISYLTLNKHTYMCGSIIEEQNEKLVSDYSKSQPV